MRGYSFRVSIVVFLLLVLYPGGSFLIAATENITAHPIEYKSHISFSPKNYTVVADSEFDASIILDTTGFTVNAVELKVVFPANLLSVVKPSSGQSIIDIWVAPPKYSNTRGTIEFAGLIPGGTKTESGLVEKITFRALAPGTATIYIEKTSRVLMNDGFGSEAVIETIPMHLIIAPKTPEGLTVISNTHPYQGEWYNNKNPVFSWEPTKAGETYSYLLDDKPYTVPDDVVEGAEPQAGFSDIKDGVWYFHLKAKNGSIWSNTTHYAIRVDTLPPAEFTPTAEFLSSSKGAPGLISFFTTDGLSGVARYEVGVLDSRSEPDSLPGFVQSESPYYLPTQISNKVLVTVRAIDHAGNARDATIDVKIPPFLMLMINNYARGFLPGIGFAVLLIGAGFYISFKRERKKIRPDELKEILDYYISKKRDETLALGSGATPTPYFAVKKGEPLYNQTRITSLTPKP